MIFFNIFVVNVDKHSDYVEFGFQKINNMNRIIKIVCLILISFTLSSNVAFASKNKSNFSSEKFWTPVMEAIIQVESGGNPRAVSGKSCGAMQITPILVTECNIILSKRNSKKRYNLSDRFDVSKSKEMFLLIQSYHNPTNNVEKAIRSWNGGPNYSMKKTQRYYEKVKKYLK